MACEIRDAELLGEDIPMGVQREYAILLETFQEDYGRDSLSKKILFDVMNGKLKDVIHDYAMRQALISFVLTDINFRELQKEFATIPFSESAKEELENAKQYN